MQSKQSALRAKAEELDRQAKLLRDESRKQKAPDASGDGEAAFVIIVLGLLALGYFFG
ncbi:hypothetical protein [Sagittula sp. S175]|uniref:hypothetical protein n=1 Tax=Sagittula sp. S175 TaxID=3415129 RepID=UPI003C7C2B1A